MKLRKTIQLTNGKRVKAGTELSFANGVATYDNEKISLAQIPLAACEYEMHETLHEDVWQDGQLREEIREKLLAIANDFYTESEFKAPILDIILTGSMANFNYNDKSDFDLHVVIDYKAESDNVELVKIAANGVKWQWIEQHNISIVGHEVEVYIQDVNEQHVASGVFSLLNNAWIVEPTFRTINTSETTVAKKVDSIVQRANALQEELAGDHDEAGLRKILTKLDELRYKAMRLRKDAFERGEDEFSVGNLAFKELRNNGTIELLCKLEIEVYDKIHSLEK